MVTTSIAPLSIAVVLALKGADASPPFLGGSCRINRYFSPDLWGGPTFVAVALRMLINLGEGSFQMARSR